MTLKKLSKKHWTFIQTLKTDFNDLYMFLNKHTPLWESIYSHAYTGASTASFETEDGLKVKMVPYRLWEMMFRPKTSMELSVYMLCCMGLMGIDEKDFCEDKEWIFYSLPTDFQLIEWYCKLLNSGIKKCKNKKETFNWINEKLENGCTYHKMVCGNGRKDRITIGNPRKLARALFD